MRLITFTGPPGVGKSRLALAVAAAVAERFADGVYLVPLAAVGDAESVAGAIAQALDVPESLTRTPVDTLIAYCRHRNLLLVLDNFEQVLPAAGLLSELLASCPRLTMLVTSRAALRLSVEHELAVPPLTVASGESGIGLSAAAHLFVSRAQAICAEFTVTPEKVAQIDALCRRLDGLPLAIELAAARTRTLSLSEIAARLDRMGLDLLTQGARDLPPRQQTLRAAIAWSYDLLTEPERGLLRVLSLFPGGCTLDAAEALLNQSSSQSEPRIDRLDLLEALVAQSLVTRHEHPGGGTRFTLLQTIREYALEQVEAGGERPLLRRRYIAHYRALCEQLPLAPANVGEAVPSPIAFGLAPEYENIRQAIEWCAEACAAEDALQMGLRLVTYWSTHERAREAHARLQEVLGIAGEAPPRLRAHVLKRAAVFARWVGEPARAEAHLDECLALCRAADDDVGAAEAQRTLGMLVWDQGRFAEAEALIAGGLAIFQARGDLHNAHTSLRNLGLIALSQGNYDRARTLIEESVAIARQSGNRRGMARSASVLGRIAHLQRQYDRALKYFGACLEVVQLGGGSPYLPDCLDSLAATCAALGESEPASRLFGAAEARREEIGVTHYVHFRDGYERDVELLRAALDDERRAALWAEGRALSLVESLDLALGLCASLSSASAPEPAQPLPGASASRTGASPVGIKPLSPRECEVAQLVARGQTNRQIAATLFITERTATSHVAHILGKIGAHSRAEIAAWIVEHGLLSTDQRRHT